MGPAGEGGIGRVRTGVPSAQETERETMAVYEPEAVRLITRLAKHIED